MVQGNFPFIIWNLAKCLCKSTWTHFVILAELSPKKPTFISILSILDLLLLKLENFHSSRRQRLRRLIVGSQQQMCGSQVSFSIATVLWGKNFFLPSRQNPTFCRQNSLHFGRCASFPTKLSGKKPKFFVESIQCKRSIR